MAIYTIDLTRNTSTATLVFGNPDAPNYRPNPKDINYSGYFLSNLNSPAELYIRNTSVKLDILFPNASTMWLNTARSEFLSEIEQSTFDVIDSTGAVIFSITELQDEPGSPYNYERDPPENPYILSLANSRAAAVKSAIDAQATGWQLRITTPSEAVSLSAQAGQPTASFDLNSSTPLSLSASAGQPVASLNLTSDDVKLSARAGNPTASFALSTDINILELEAYTLTAGLYGVRQPVGHTIPSDLIAGGSNRRRITNIIPWTNSQIYFQLDSGDPEFTDVIERSAVFDIFNPNGDIVLTLNGLKDEPGSRDTDSNPDYTNPYNIDLADSRGSVLSGQLTTLLTAGGVIDVTGWQLRIAIPDIVFEPVSVSARAGQPTAAVDLKYTPPTSTLSLSAKAGQPTAAFNLIYTPSLPLSVFAKAGQPTATLNLTADNPSLSLSIFAKTGQPTASFNLKYTPPTSTLSLSAKAGQPTATFDLTRDLQLSDFNARGLELEFAGLLRASSAGTVNIPGTLQRAIYATSQRGGSDSPIDGDLLINNDGTAITRIRHDQNQLLFNDNTNLNLNTYFGTNGDGNDLTIHIQTATAKASLIVANTTGRLGGGFANFILTSAFETILNSIPNNGLFILAATRSLPAESVSVSANAGQPTAILDLAHIPAISLSISARAGQPTATTFDLEYTPPVSKLSLSAKAGRPTTSLDLTNRPPLNILALAGLPAASFALSAVNPAILTLSAKAGDPTASLDLTNRPPLNILAQAGQPTATVDLKYTPPTSTLSLSAKAGQPTALFDLTRDLQLSDFNARGLEIEFVGLLRASGVGTNGNTIYATSQRDGSDSPIDGDILIDSDGTAITRLRILSDNLLINDDTNLNLNTYFGTNGDGNDLTIHIQTNAGKASLVVADTVGRLGGGFANFGLTPAFETIVNGLTSGDLFLFAATRPLPAEDLAVSANAGQPTATLDLAHIPAISLSVSAKAGLPTTTFALSIIDPVVLTLSAKAGLPTTLFDLTASNPVILTLSVKAGNPTTTFDLKYLRYPATLVSLSVKAGLPTTTFDLKYIPPIQKLNLSAKAGQPTTLFDLTASNPVILALSVRAGLPTTTFDLKYIRYPAESVAVSAKAGLPTTTFKLLVKRPEVLLLTLYAKAGRPTATAKLKYIRPVPIRIPSTLLSLSARAGRPTVSFESETTKLYIGMWHPDLPYLFEASGYTDEFAEQVYHSAIERYDDISRRSDRRENKANLQGIILMNIKEWNILKQWYNTSQGYGSLPFLFPDPDIVTEHIKVGFAKPPIISSTGHDLYSVRLTLEQK